MAKGKQIKYKGFVIDDHFCYPNLITVQYGSGDDIIYKSVAEAKKDIDKYIKEQKRI